MCVRVCVCVLRVYFICTLHIIQIPSVTMSSEHSGFVCRFLSEIYQCITLFYTTIIRLRRIVQRIIILYYGVVWYGVVWCNVVGSGVKRNVNKQISNKR